MNLQTNKRGTNQTGMREYNEKLVLTLLRREGAMPKAELANRTGLSAQTVSVIMRKLEEDAFLIKGEPMRGKIGQPSVPFSLNPEGAFFLGLKIGRRSAEMMLINFLGDIIEHKRTVYKFPNIKGVIDFAILSAKEITDQMDRAHVDRLAGLGAATPFELWNWATQIGLNSEDMIEWKDFDLYSTLSAHFDLPIFVQNDASSACAAELTFGKKNHPSNFLYIYIGHFVGGGIVIGDKLFTGNNGNAGAIGPKIIQNLQGHNVQLLETCSIATLEKELKDHGADPKAVWQVDEGWHIPENILEKWLAENANGLAQAIYSALTVIDFDAVMIDGWFPEGLSERLTQITMDKFSKFDLAGLNHPDIMSGSMGKNARPLGAASLPLSKRYMVD